jgi:hypothetical protein
MQAFGILVRLWTWALVLRVLKHVVPLPRLVRLAQADLSREVRSGAFERRLEGYLERRQRFPFRAPGNCLERSLGAYRLLCAQGSNPELRVGIAVNSQGHNAQLPKVQLPRVQLPNAQLPMRGHVWVEVDGRPFGERPGDLDGLTPVLTFGADGQAHAASGFGDVSSIRIP